MLRYLSPVLGLLLAACLHAQDHQLYSLDKVREVRLYFEQENWDDILDSLKQQGYDQRLVGDAVYNDKRYHQVGVRYKGNSSYFSVRKDGFPKLPFNIDFNHTHKEEKLPGGIDKMKLSNVFRDPSFLREVLSYEIANKYMPSPRANFVQLYINDKYMGLYNNTESVEDEFLERFFGDDDGVLFKCDPAWGFKDLPSCPDGDKSSLQYLGPDSACYRGKYEIKTDKGWKELIELTRVLKHEPEKLDSLFQVDEALWMLAFNMVLANLDSYTGRFCHNYYLYQDKTGVLHPIIWDLNLSFGGFRYDGVNGSPLTNEEMQTLSPFTHYKQKNEKRPLITQLLSDDLYRKMYVAHIRTILEDNFVDSTYLKRAREVQGLIDEYVMKDTNKLYTYEAFKENLYESTKAGKVSIIGIAELMEPRTKYLMEHPLVSKTPPQIAKVEHLDFGDIMVFNAELEEAERAWLFYRFGKLGSFQKLEMFDDSGHDDKMAEDGTWGATVKKMEDKEIQYFIVAESQYAAALSPERASFEFYSTTDSTDTAKKDSQK